MVEDGLGAERRRLAEARAGTAPWRRWGPYVVARQWGTVREDYSEGRQRLGLRSPTTTPARRAYRWGEDGLGGISDRWQHLCFGVTLWNTNDKILKERLFGLTNSEGNHGEDAKEYWWALDSTPTHSCHAVALQVPAARVPVRAARRREPWAQP